MQGGISSWSTLELTDEPDGGQGKLRSWHALCFSISSPVSEIVICSTTFMGHSRAPGILCISVFGMGMENPEVMSESFSLL